MNEEKYILNPKAYKLARDTYLDNEFKKKYPVGCFSIHRGNTISLYLNFTRCVNGSPFYPKSFGVASGGELEAYKNNCFGKVTRYNKLDNFIKACKKYGVKEQNIDLFVKVYNELINNKINYKVKLINCFHYLVPK